MDDIIKIGISGNALGSGGYCNLINVGFDDVVVNRQVSFKGQTDTEYSIEVQQGKNEAIFVLVANPLTVYSAGASRGGALCIFLSIPAGKYVRKKDTTPLTILHDILKKFREENMIQRGNVWEYQYKAFYDRTPFQKLSEDTKQYLAELPTYVPMAGNSELLVSIGDKLEAFFAGDFQYPKFKECSRLVIADHIDGSNWEPEIPRSWSLAVYYGSSFVATLDSSNPEISHKFSPAPSDADIYDETEIKLRLDGYNVQPTGCEVNVKWNDEKVDGKVEIKSIQWNLRQIFVPITLKGEGIESLSPDEIVCTIADALGNPQTINPVKKEGEVMGFEFDGLQIRDVKEEMFHISNEFYNFKVRLESVKGLPEGILIMAEQKQEQEQEPKPEPKSEPKAETVQTQTSSHETPKSNPSQFSQSAQDYANNNPKKENCNEGETAGHVEDNLQQKPSSPKHGTETNTSNNATDGVSEVKIESEESKLKFYRKKEFWIGLAVGFILGIVLCFAAGIVYSILPKSELKEELSNYKMPDKVKEPALFIYNEDEIDKAVVFCNKADSLLNSADSLKHKGKIDVSNPLKVISDQAEHFKNLLYKLEDNGYKLKFEDPCIIKEWINNERIGKLNISDAEEIKPFVSVYGSLGESINNILTNENRGEAYSNEYSKFQSYNDRLEGEELSSRFMPIRACIQVFYFYSSKTPKNKKCKDDIVKDTGNDPKYKFTPQYFKDIYDRVK